MSDNLDRVETKVLIHDSSLEAITAIRSLCDTPKIVRIKSVDVDVLEFFANPSIVHSDISAIFLTELPDQQGLTGIHIAEKINQIRGALPIFIRRSTGEPATFTEENLRLFAGSYTLEEPDQLKHLVDKYLFATHYPLILVNLIRKTGEMTIRALLKNVEVTATTPVLIRDYITSNSIVGKIPINLACGKGYLSFKAREDDLAMLVCGGNTALNPSSTEPREYQQLVSELTNLMWGGLRKELPAASPTKDEQAPLSAEIPIVSDFIRKSINFGGCMPQLSFRYLIYRQQNPSIPLIFDFTILFNIRWAPEHLQDLESLSVDQAIESGELELL